MLLRFNRGSLEHAVWIQIGPNGLPGRRVENYLFRLDEVGNGTAAWGTVRGGGLTQKNSLFMATSRSP